MKKTLPKAYEPKTFEKKWYSYWVDNDLFRAKVRPGKPRFSIVIPPPNVTGALHMGHALDTTLQDIFVRYNRMLGKETLWLPGTDHASIATHAKIEEMLVKEGTSRWELGREKFLVRAWQWKNKYGHIITDQLKTLGASCDWSRERFTMDEGCSRAVNEVFVRLYEKGLIYRGKYMVNFCPGCRTVISDIEVEHQEVEGALYYIRYPILDSETNASSGHIDQSAEDKPASEYTDFIEVATTRPETMLGDTAIAVNPEDPRYKRLVGKHAILPLVGRILPIISDDRVDPDFGTGAVKVTPAHDPDDFEMAQKHGLRFISVINTEGRMTQEAGKYKGLDRYECREKLLLDLQAKGYLVKKEPYRFSVGHCHRCDSVVEPLISEQWFVKMKPLAEPALRIVREGKIKFVPERFTKIYEHWMENVKDWCISRQLWWGHRIPAWYCKDCGKVTVARKAPEKCPACSGPLYQDEDVLDTWFSSALWPFSTMGWPDDTPDLKYFFPTDILVTGYDIIFFWVARMIFSSMEFMGREPFHHVLIHGLVRDALGRKMSKSLGNGIDPLEVVDKYGADALRLSLTSGIAMGNDMRFYDEKVEGARNFCNKLWNATRYCLSNLEGWQPPVPRDEAQSTERDKSNIASNEKKNVKNEAISALTSRWILSRLERTIRAVNDAMDRFEPGETLDIITNFVWNEFCDWYIEFSKEDLTKPEKKDETRYVLWQVLKDSLALLHPFAPFITEELWSHLPGRKPGKEASLTVSAYPTPGRYSIDNSAEEEINTLIEAVKQIRNMRAEVNIPTGKKTRVILIAENPAAWENKVRYIQRLAWAQPLEVLDRKKSPARPQQALASVGTGVEIYLPLKGVIDLEKEIGRLETSASQLEQDLKRIEARLSNPEFLAKAPKEIVETHRKRCQESKEKIEALRKRAEVLRRVKN